MKLRALVLPCLLSAGLWVPAAHAQRQGTLEFGLYARKNWFGESYALANRVGGGARLGFYLLRHLELEANGAYIPSEYEYLHRAGYGTNSYMQLSGTSMAAPPPWGRTRPGMAIPPSGFAATLACRAEPDPPKPLMRR